MTDEQQPEQSGPDKRREQQERNRVKHEEHQQGRQEQHEANKQKVGQVAGRMQEWADDPKELEEYHYYVGHVEITAMMTPEMAEQVGAVPVDEDLEEPEGGKEGNNEANRLSTRSREADDAGVTSEEDPDGKTATGKARNARNKRAGGS
jgi:hypothetical protein